MAWRRGEQIMVSESGNVEGIPQTSVQAYRLLDDAKTFLQSGKYEKAQDACRELIGEHAEYVGALETLGQAYVAVQNYDTALPAFIRASMLSPYEPSILVQLGQVYFNLGASETALQTAQDALSLQPDDALAGDAHLLLGRVHERRSNYEQAREHLDQALSFNPELNDAAMLLGGCLLELGERAGCVKMYATALEGDVSPMDRARALYGLAGCADAKTAKNLLAQIEDLSDQASSFDDAEEERAIFDALLELAKAALLDIQGKHDAAWDALKAGNAPMHKLMAEKSAQAIDHEKYALERAAGWNFAGAATSPLGYSPPLSLFLLGPPQAGKSTLERLTGALDGCKPGHESNIVHAVAARTSNSSGLMTLHFPGQLPPALHETFTQNYAEELTMRAPEATLFTITHPGTISDLGRIAETVPDMRVIFVDRDKDDMAHRIFGKIYPLDTNPFAYDMAHIRDYFDGYTRLVDAWSAHLGELAIRVSYKDIIADPKGTLAKITELCGLPAPNGELPDLGDDRGCAKAYLDYLKEARG